ncbi:MAG: substrate-binding domain-containing protein [Opitutaceae bacterium]
MLKDSSQTSPRLPPTSRSAFFNGSRLSRAREDTRRYVNALIAFVGLGVALPTAFAAEELRFEASIPTRALVPLIEPSFRAVRPGTKMVSAVADTAQVLERLRNGQIQVGILTRNLKKPELEERPAFVAQPIGSDALVVAVHASNPVTGLTGDQIRGIWSGEIENWRELGGRNLPIRVVGRTKKYDPIQLFGDFMKLESRIVGSSAEYRVKGQERWSTRKVLVVDSDDEALQALLSDPATVSYFPIARLLRERANQVAIKGLRLDGVEATAATVADKGAYYLRRTLNAVTKGPPDAASLSFIRFLLSPEGQQLVSKAGFMPLSAVAAASAVRAAEHP